MEVDSMEGLNDRLKIAREGLHLSQDYVAKQLGLNRTAMVQIEAGNRKIAADELSGFSRLYGISVDELLNGSDASKPKSVFARSFFELDEADQREILNLIEFKRMMKEQRIR
jgi:transcriptional regulator with XRE-family HTH domain